MGQLQKSCLFSSIEPSAGMDGINIGSPSWIPALNIFTNLKDGLYLLFFILIFVNLKFKP